MDRKEPAAGARQSEFANQGEISEGDLAILGGIAGRADNLGAEPGSLSAEDVVQPIGAQPRSAVTGQHQPGMGANETEDGLSGTEEMTRQAAEDLPPGEDDIEDVPVFDRADLLPRV